MGQQWHVARDGAGRDEAIVGAADGQALPAASRIQQRSVTRQVEVPVPDTLVFLFTPGPVKWKLWMFDLS